MKILIADDHDLLRDTLKAFLDHVDGIDTVVVGDVAAAVDAIGREGPFDLVLLDYGMPGMGGFKGLEDVLAASGGRPVAIMSGTASRTVAEQALARGAAGFVPKTLTGRSLVNAMRFMASGEKFMPVAVPAVSPGMTEPSAQLSVRELQVLRGLRSGLSNKEIGRELELKEPTVKLYVRTLCGKLSARNRTQAAMIAQECAID